VRAYAHTAASIEAGRRARRPKRSEKLDLSFCVLGRPCPPTCAAAAVPEDLASEDFVVEGSDRIWPGMTEQPYHRRAKPREQDELSSRRRNVAHASVSSLATDDNTVARHHHRVALGRTFPPDRP
jgi:hypothetical protein